MKIEKLDHFGRGIGYLNGKITFVKAALPNEIVKISLVKEKAKMNEAEIVSIEKESENRIKPICPYYEDCGGCHLLHLNYEEELKYKEQKVKEILFKFADIPSSKVKKIIATKEYHYRNKATFQVSERVGYFKEKSNILIPINYCYLVDEKINSILSDLQEMNLKSVNQIIIRVSKNDSMVIFKSKGKINVDFSKLNVGNIIFLEGNNYKIKKGNNFIVETVGNCKYQISPDSFFQVNTEGCEILYNKIKELVGHSKNLLDLYCGTGSIGIYLHDIVSNITGIEINAAAIEDAKKNAQINNLNNVHFICSPVSKAKLNNDYDTIIVDPPRSGLDKNIIEYLKKSLAEKIIYVSCDPVTLGRDLKELKDTYDIVEVTPVNLFSRTYHVENIVILKKYINNIY